MKYDVFPESTRLLNAIIAAPGASLSLQPVPELISRLDRDGGFFYFQSATLT